MASHGSSGSGGSATSETSDSVRGRIYRGGRQLVIRQGAGSVLRLVAVLVVTRLVGPSEYGYYAAAASVLGVLSTLATFGVDVDLVRVPDVDSRDEHVAFTVITGAALVVGVTAAVLAPLYGRWIDDGAAVAPLRVAMFLIPLAVAPVPARARLERNLDFGVLAVVEVAADLIVVLVSVPLALAGAGVWAPVAGLGARLLWLCGALPIAARYRPALCWDPDRIRNLARFGGRYTVGRWMSISSTLINPLLIGRLAGPVGVAHVAVASRIIEQVGAVKQVAVRLATPALARVKNDRGRLAAAHAEGSLIQVLGAVPAYAGVAFLAPWLLPALLGPEWSPAVPIVALLAVAASVGAVFNLHAPLLHVLDRPGSVALVRFLQLLALVAATVSLVPIYGTVGYGAARIVRCLPFGVMHRQVRTVFVPRYRPMLRWLIGLVPPMFSSWLAAPIRAILLVPLVAVLALPESRAELASVIRRVAPRIQLRRRGPTA